MDNVKGVLAIIVEQENHFDESIALTSPMDNPLFVACFALAIAAHFASHQRLDFGYRAPMLGRMFQVPRVPAEAFNLHDD